MVLGMNKRIEEFKRYLENHTFDSGDSGCKTVLDQLYRAYAESHEDDPPGIREGFKELESFWRFCPWTITILCSTFAAGSAWPMNTKPS